MFNLVKYTNKIADLKERVISFAQKAGVDFDIIDKDDRKFQLVFVGQYSAGKSSIIKAITGRDDIKIGAGITTETVQKYSWNSIEVIDTPGINTKKRPDHDELAYEAIASADMLVYVTSNELIDGENAKHFRKLAIDQDKAGEMVFVINKMVRADKGNDIEQQTATQEGIMDFIAPYTPEQLNLCFMDAKSYLASLEKRKSNPKFADKLENRSGYKEFIETLNRFISEKNYSSRLTTIIYEMESFLESTSNQIEPEISDADLKALVENYRQQRDVLSDSRKRLRQEIKDIFTDAAADIHKIGLESAEYLCEGCEQENVEEKLRQAIQRSEDIIEACQEKALSTFTDRLNEIGQDFQTIENSEFSKDLKIRLINRIDTFSNNIKRILNQSIIPSQKAGETVLKGAYNASAEGGLKLTNFSGSTIHNMVLKAGHMLKFKFRPWQAIKITKGIAIGGQVLNAFGVGLSIFMQLKEDHDAEQRREDLRKNRQIIRAQFNNAANELEEHGKKFIKDNISSTLDIKIQNIDNAIREILEEFDNKSKLCSEAENLQMECDQLIRQIHSLDYSNKTH